MTLRDAACELCGVITRAVALPWARWEAKQHEAKHTVEGKAARVYVVKTGTIYYHANGQPSWPQQGVNLNLPKEG